MRAGRGGCFSDTQTAQSSAHTSFWITTATRSKLSKVWRCFTNMLMQVLHIVKTVTKQFSLCLCFSTVQNMNPGEVPDRQAVSIRFLIMS